MRRDHRLRTRLVALACLVWGCAAVAAAQNAAGPTRGQGTPQNGPARSDPSAGPLAPEWFPLPAKHQEYLDKVLQFWEHRSGEVKRYRCAFQRWEYDPRFGPADTFKTYSEGQIMYASPDKGLFRVDKLMQYQAPRDPNAKPSYAEQSGGDYWVCDGKSIYQFDHPKKQLIETRLPKEMQGKQISEGPLPFLFGARVDELKRRYWMRVITPQDAKGEYWLEAIPKMQQDAANYRAVNVILDEADYLPKMIRLFGRAQGSKTTFTFAQREVNWSILPAKLNIFHRAFYRPEVPRGWKLVERDYGTADVAQQPAPPARR